MANTKPLRHLSVCVLIACFTILAAYWFRSGRILPRVAFAIFMSVLPLLVAWPITEWRKSSGKETVVTYILVFVLSLLFQGWLRTL